MEMPVDGVSLWLFALTAIGCVIIGAVWGYMVGRTDGKDASEHLVIEAQNAAAADRAALHEMKMDRGMK